MRSERQYNEAITMTIRFKNNENQKNREVFRKSGILSSAEELTLWSYEDFDDVIYYRKPASPIAAENQVMARMLYSLM